MNTGGAAVMAAMTEGETVREEEIMKPFFEKRRVIRTF